MMSWLRALERVLLPDGCARCGRETRHAPFCGSCRPGRLSPEPVAPPAGVDAWFAAAPYAAEWREWIRRFKFPAAGLAGLDPAAEAVAAWLIECAAAEVPAPFWPDRVVSVPLHEVRLVERGFDQAAWLAQRAARATKLPRAPDLLVRHRATRKQTGLSRSERHTNLQGAFRATRPSPARVWLVDDVATTGSTLRECARVLRAAGAVQVVGLCAAFTPLGESDDDPLHPAPWRRSGNRSP